MTLSDVHISVLHLNVLSCVLIVLTTCTIVARLFTKLFITRKAAISDALIFCAWAAFMAQIACTWAAIQPFLQLLAGDVSVFKQAIHFINSATVLYICSMTCLKIALGLFFLDFFPPRSTQRYILYTLLTSTIIVSFIELMIAVSTCALTAYYFAPETCGIFPPYRNLNRAWGVLNLVTDLAFPLLAIDALRRAKLSRASRMVAWTVVALGFCATAAACLRVAALVGNNNSASVGKSIASGFWTQLELGLGIACANSAVLWPLVRAVRKKRCKTTPDSSPFVPARRWGRNRGVLSDSTRLDSSCDQQLRGIGSMVLGETVDGRPSVLWRLRSVLIMDPEKGNVGVCDRHDEIDGACCSSPTPPSPSPSPPPLPPGEVLSCNQEVVTLPLPLPTKKIEASAVVVTDLGDGTASSARSSPAL